MATQISNFKKCPECAADCADNIKNCPSCYTDLGFPNVRIADSERPELEERYNDIFLKFCNKSNVKAKLDELINFIKSDAHVIVATSELFAKSFLINRKLVYNNYESQVKSRARPPAPFEEDANRSAVGGKLFGSFADKIIYGALSLNNQSLKNYGNVFFILKDNTISKRVSFLVENSYLFLERNAESFLKPLPKGYKSTWTNKWQLVISKFAEKLEPDFDAKECAKLLVVHGIDRKSDSCIEAHIFGEFDSYSVSKISFSEDTTSKDKRVIKSLANKLNIGVLG